MATDDKNTGTPAAKAETNGTPNPKTPPKLDPNSVTASAGRPVTTTPNYGDPTVDRLSLDPADSDDWVTRTKLWVEENPVLAVVGAVGLGLLVGRVVMAAVPDPAPQTLTDKIEARAKVLAKQGKYAANDAGDAISQQLAVAADALSEAAQAVSVNAKQGYGEAKDFTETIAEAIGDAFSKKASEWMDKVS
ncbi:MAG: hypothetical protein AAGI91_03700 [Bacteroidota bacterium]